MGGTIKQIRNRSDRTGESGHLGEPHADHLVLVVGVVGGAGVPGDDLEPAAGVPCGGGNRAETEGGAGMKDDGGKVSC